MKKFIKKLIGIEDANEHPRHRWVEQLLEGLPAGSRILDAGAGEKRYKKFCGHLTYVSQDFAQYDGQGDSVGLQTGSWDQSDLDIVSDIAAIPEPSASFDAIMCTEVFEHVQDPVAVLREFDRLLKPGGHLIITAPFCSLTHFAPYHFYSGFNRYFYTAHLQALGFDIVTMDPNGNFFDYLRQELARIPAVAKTYTNKTIYPWHYAIWALAIVSLRGFSAAGSRSADLLTFGYHVYAIKKI